MSDADLPRLFRDINLSHLATFLAVIEVGSFRGAAERMSISQSALSTRVRQLEQALGVALLYRTTRSVTLTPQGEAMREPLRRVCGDLLRLMAGLREEASLQRGLVSVVVLPSLAASLLPRLALEFSAKYSGIELRLRDADSVTALAMLRRGGTDIALLPHGHGLEGLLVTPLFDEELLVVLPAGDGAARSRHMALVDVAKRPLVLNPRGIEMREALEGLFREAGLMPRVVQEMVANPSVVAMVAAGIGATILPRTALSGLDLAGCRTVPLRPRSTRAIAAVTTPERDLSPPVRAFRDFLAARCGVSDFASE
ncbi:LysR family transcriptional regulator [Sabulicella rubraurantiaca]|uniref:LysR family transcriptional regulator n=1 Tax=Sabulicella rubraurantiaca TaxID=2811429 RepID=UPI001A973676|nr:LysR family transcriptional regulator [Sabulicella rubraurantiaca]